MKLLVAVAIVCAFQFLAEARPHLTSDQRKKLVEYSRQCATDTNVDVDIVLKARQGQFPDNEKLREYAMCMAKKMGFIDDNNKIQKEVIKEKVSAAVGDSSLVTTLMNECLDEIPDEFTTATTYTFVKCIYDRSPMHIFIL